MDKRQNNKLIACVTGGSGMIGSKIVDLLLTKGYTVMVLTRQQKFNKQVVEIVHGSLEN
jgi:nucleoside-diphosphate-sugar epimerase